jgi:small subunit ribosomal protein S6
MYEAMFLADPAVAAMWDNLTKHLRGILERQGAQVLGITRWDERKLAYPVKRQKRGTYVLAFFALEKTDGLPEIERDCRLSDQILRVLIVRADQFSLSDMRLQLGEDMDTAVAQKLAAERGENIEAQPGAGIRAIERHARDDSRRNET